MHFVRVKGILSAHNGMNLYRGCSHGCIYCDSRSKCYGMTHPFEDVEVKENAVELLEAALRRKRCKCMIGTGAMTDPYLPLEAKLCLTRRSLEVIRDNGFGVTLITKSSRVLRDLDLLREINARTKAVVQMTLTTFDDELCRILEPHVSVTSERFAALTALRDAGIPTVVWLSPILPYINDTAENINGILDLCAEAKVYGVICFGMGLTLREGNREYFFAQLDKHFPGMKERYVREFGNQYILSSPRQEELMRLFQCRCEASGMVHNMDRLFAYLQEFPRQETGEQLSLWDLPTP